MFELLLRELAVLVNVLSKFMENILPKLSETIPYGFILFDKSYIIEFVKKGSKVYQKV